MANEYLEFGPELRRRRLAAGLTLAQLASLVHYSKAQLSKVERGLKAPSRELGRLCDTALRARGTLASLADVEIAPDESLVGQSEEVIWLMQVSEDGASHVRSATRRQLMMAGLLSLPAAGASGRITFGRTEHPVIPDAFRSIFDHYRGLGQVSDPELLIPPLITQNHLLQELAKKAAANNREKMLVLSSRYTEYIGWLFQEAGDDQAALRWTRKAADLARASGDPDFATYGLVRHALVTMYQGDAAQTIQLARQAQDLSPPPRISGLAALREAQGYALAGDYGSSMRAIDRAAELLRCAGEDGKDHPVVGTSNVPDAAEMARGWCLYDLGRPAAAERALGEQLATVPPRAARTRVRYGVRRALAAAAAGEIDRSCQLISDVLSDTGTTRSATIARDLRILSRVLARHPKNQSARELSPRLTAVLHATAAL